MGREDPHLGSRPTGTPPGTGPLDLLKAKKTPTTGARRISELEQVLLALDYAEATDNSAHGYTPYRGGIWEIKSGGLPGQGRRA